MDLFGETPATPAPEKADTPAQAAPSALDLMAAAPLYDEDEEQGGLADPRASTICLGHDAVEQQLLELYNSGRMPHGLIFSGIKGIGKATFAYRLAKFLFKNGLPADPNQVSMFGDAPVQPDSLDVPNDDPNVALVLSDGHPDMLTIERLYDSKKNTRKASVTVDEVRRVNPFLRLTASGGGWRVVIIDDADTMNRSSQNALLKILEEPPKNTIIILITHRLGALIPTIRSRTRLINFQPLANAQINELLDISDHSIMQSDQANLVSIAEGSIGNALQFLEEGGLDTLTQIIGIIKTYPRWSWTEIHVLADYFARKGQEKGYESFQYILRWIFTSLCKAKGRGITQLESSIFANDALQQMLHNSSLEQLLNICENLEEHFAKAKYANLDKKQAVIGAFSIIAG